MWVVEIEEGCWLAPWGGDPGRTLVRESAKQYRSEYAAHCALERSKRLFKSRDLSRAQVALESANNDGLNAGTPEDNCMKFCCYCGKPLREVPFKSDEETEE